MANRKQGKKERKSVHNGGTGISIGMSVQKPERRAGHKPVGDKDLPRRDDLVDPVTRRGEVPIAVEDQDPDRTRGRVPSVRDQGQKPSRTHRNG